MKLIERCIAALRKRIASQTKPTEGILLNPLSLGITYFGFSIMLLGLEHQTGVTKDLGWVAFGVSVLLFIAIFVPCVAKLVNGKGGVALLSSAYSLGILDITVGVLSFLSGKGGWIVWVFLISLLLWLFVITGAQAGVAKNKRLILLVPLTVLIISLVEFGYSHYIQGGVLLALSVFIFIAAERILKLPPPDA